MQESRKNLTQYLNNMEEILKECYRVLDNHRVFVFNVGDVFDNDNIFTTSTWGKRKLPLGAYFIILFEKVGFTFVDDIIWDKEQVQSQRHKNGNRPYSYYQYPMNCYEHILIFLNIEMIIPAILAQFAVVYRRMVMPIQNEDLKVGNVRILTVLKEAKQIVARDLVQKLILLKMKILIKIAR